MSAAYAAERIVQAIENGIPDAEFGVYPVEDMRTGGFFFDVEIKGRNYEVLVQEVRHG